MTHLFFGQPLTKRSVLCGGDCEAAASLLSGEATAFRKAFARQLASRPMPVVELSKTVTGFVEEAGKDAPQRRDRLPKQRTHFEVPSP
jgi:hypothetical protein